MAGGVGRGASSVDLGASISDFWKHTKDEKTLLANRLAVTNDDDVFIIRRCGDNNRLVYSLCLHYNLRSDSMIKSRLNSDSADLCTATFRGRSPAPLLRRINRF